MYGNKSSAVRPVGRPEIEWRYDLCCLAFLNLPRCSRKRSPCRRRAERSAGRNRRAGIPPHRIPCRGPRCRSRRRRACTRWTGCSSRTRGSAAACRAPGARSKTGRARRTRGGWPTRQRRWARRTLRGCPPARRRSNRSRSRSGSCSCRQSARRGASGPRPPRPPSAGSPSNRAAHRARSPRAWRSRSSHRPRCRRAPRACQRPQGPRSPYSASCRSSSPVRSHGRKSAYPPCSTRG